MGLSSELISQFVKITKDKETSKSESTAYGTVVKYNNKTYVKLDGSELLTPVTTTTDVEENERVTVTIKDHTATVMGNLSSPSARTDTVKEIDNEVTVLSNQITEFGIVIADKVSTTELDAERGRIDILVSDNVTINEKLVAAEADIGNLEANKASITELNAEKGRIDTLETDKASVKDLNVEKGRIDILEANTVSITELNAEKARIDTLEANTVSITELNAEKARIDTLESTMITSDHAVIKNLQSDVADIDTLIFGSASGSTIQTSFANAVIAQLGNAQIKSAMIEDISASKIKAGNIITNNVQVMSEDGNLIISDETLQISDGARVRVQIGKDASNDYSINIWDASGNLMFSKGGITDAAIKDAIIRNDMVAANANISASKLDIDSLFEEINGSSNTIKSTKVYLDEKGQTLDAAFTSMTTDVNGIRGTVESQGTQISVMQGKIENKIWQTDIDTTVDKLEIGGRNLVQTIPLATASLHGITISQNGYDYTISGTNTHNANYGIGGNWLRPEHLNLEPGETYTLSTSKPLPYGLYLGWNGMNSAGTGVALGYLYGPNRSITFTIPTTYQSFTMGFFGVTSACGTVDCTFRIKLEKGNKATDWTPAPEDVEGEISTLSTKYSEVKQTVDGLSTTVSSHTAQIANKADGSEVTAVNSKVTALEQNLSGFKTTVSETYTTKTEFNNLQIGGRNILYNSSLHDNLDKWEGGGALIVTEDGYKCARINGAFNETKTIYQHILSRIEPNQRYTFSGWFKTSNIVTGSTNCYIAIYNDGNYSNNGVPTWFGYDTKNIVIGVQGWQYLSYTFTTDNRLNTATSYRFYVYGRDFTGYIYFRDLKLEKGTKATDWTPAPEDTTAEIELRATKTEVNQLSDKITTNVTETTALGMRMSTVEQKADGLTVSLQNTQNELANIEIGGRNLWVSSNTVDGYYGADGGYVDVPSMPDHKAMSVYIDTMKNSYLCYQVWNPNKAINTVHEARVAFYDSDKVPVGYEAVPRLDGSTYQNKIMNIPTSAQYMRLGVLAGPSNTFDNEIKFKFEFGNKTTDWTPAPEDVDASISNAQSTANTAQSAANTAQSTANAAQSTANTAQSTADTAQSTAQTAKTAAHHSASLNYAQGKMLYTDPTFAKGSNSMSVYDNSNSGYVTVIRTAKSSDNPFTDSAYELTITNTGYCNPGLGGFCVVAPGKQNATYVWRIVAKIPVGYTLAFASNAVGTGGDAYINLTGMTGTGRFTEYVGKVQYGTGSVSTTGFWFLKGTAGTASNPVKWYVAYATMWDMTNTADVTNAAKTATNYLNFSSSGLVVGDMTASTLGNNVLIDNDSVDIRNGTTTLASYQANKIELAKNSPSAVIDMCSGTAQFTNKNDVSGIDWYRLGIASRDSIGLETGGEVTMDTHHENAAGDYADGIFRMSSCQPWNMDVYGFEEAYAHWIVKNKISGVEKTAKIELYPQLGTNLYHTHKAGTAGVYLYGGGGTGDAWSTVSRIDLEAEVMNVKTSSFKMAKNAQIFGVDPNGVVKNSFIPQNQYGNTIVGYDNYSKGSGNTNIYGQDINIATSEAGNVTYRPYYRGNGLTSSGDSITMKIRTAGILTNSGKTIQFTVPLSKPIIGNPTITASSVDGFQFRCNGFYTHGSSAETYAKPDSYSVLTTNGGNNVVIAATFSNTTNVINNTTTVGARNNSPIAIYWSGQLTITFG